MDKAIFKSNRSIFFSSVVVITVVGLLAICVIQLITLNGNILGIIPMQIICWLCIGFLLSIFFNTHYKIYKSYLFYRSGPINGKIEISNIREIIIGQKFIIGFKPATGNNGLVIKYNRWDEIYISPDSNEGLIKLILEINPAVILTDLRT
ncbi:hypothetical protein DHW03_07185 [Pedobacter yonginense]|uniref:Uncharacterized protein YyaB-like PH domain-containing protein n=1 Tax=Pedobacter yonginense TaxID=651869 RepID=A0A317EKN5_9SPHI|nr:PH domain-containing protein [Pedobacter yonginense]PWS27391.1 hypothetical protein DHW03_07185 [Pedobacter yonginense]